MRENIVQNANIIDAEEQKRPKFAIRQSIAHGDHIC